MPKIFILCEYSALNGGERSMLSTLDGVIAAGFQPVVLAPPVGALADALAAKSVEQIPFSCMSPDGSRISQHSLRENLAEILRLHRPTLLHANSLAMGRLSGPVADDLNVPSMSHIRDIVKLSVQAAADVNRHHRLLAVSRATRDFHAAAGLDPSKIHVLYNGVDLEQFHPRGPSGYLHRELGLSPDCQLIGTIGQISLRKGQDVLLEAALQIADRCAAAHWLIVGQRHSDKDETCQFENRLRDMAAGPLAGRVHFLGVRRDAAGLLNELTLLVHPARQEPLGRVLLEAAASGATVIAAATGGTVEIFPHETNSAVLVPPDDPHELADAMQNLLNDPPLRRGMANAARRRAEEQFDLRQAVENLMKHYATVI